MGVGRARDSERTCSPSCPRPRLVDLERESSPRRRPVRVRRRRSQRRAERGERTEGGELGWSSRAQISGRTRSLGGLWGESPEICSQDRPTLNPRHPVHNVRRHHPTRDRRASARCSLGAERGGWGCRVDVRNWGGVTPTWRAHTGSAGAHLQIRSEFRSSEFSNWRRPCDVTDCGKDVRGATTGGSS